MMGARRTGLVVGLLLAAGAATATHSASAQSSPTLRLQPASAQPGDSVEATGDHFPAEARAVDLRVDGITGPKTAEGITPDSSGHFVQSFTVPPGTSPGPHDIVACYQPRSAAYRCVARAQLTVQSPPTTAPPRATTTQPSPTTTVPPRSTTTSPRTTTSAPPGASTTQPPVGVATTGTTLPGSLAGETTTSTEPLGAGEGLAGQTTTTGFGVGGLSGGDPADLFITAVEVSQSIQNMENEMPLVGGRTTIVRVYLRTNGGGMANVAGAIQADGAGPPVVVLPDNGPITVTEAGSDRLDIDSTLQFTLPPPAVAPGETQLAIFVYGGVPSSVDDEPSSANNWSYRFLDFEKETSLAVRLFPIHTHETSDQGSPDDTIGSQGVSDVFLMGGTFPAAYRYHPISELIPLPGQTLFPMAHHADNNELPLVMQHWDPDLDGHMSMFNSVLLDLWEQTTPATEYEQFYGVFREKPAEWGGLSNGTVANGEISLAVDSDSPWYQSTGGKTMIHELAHNVGFKHNLCKGTEPDGGPVEPYPYTGPPCLIAPEDSQGWFGIDVAWQSYTAFDAPSVISNSASVGAPFRAHPVMGYENPRWADPYFWCRSLEFYGIDCVALAIPENQGDGGEGAFVGGDEPEPAGDAPTEGHLRISALVHLPDDQVTLLDTRRSPSPLSHALAEHRRRRGLSSAFREFYGATYTLELTGGGGEVLLSAPLQMLDTPDHPVGKAVAPQVVLLSELVPYPAGTAQLRIQREGTVLVTRPVSPSVPTIEVTAVTVADDRPTVRWQGADADGDALRYNVAYSPDGGTTWIGLVVGLEGDSYTHPDKLPGGRSPVLRVEASDGVHTASDRSDPFTLRDGPPVLTILSPAPDVELPTHNVVLRTGAWDLEDGATPRPVVRWASDRDGDLGEGSWLVGRLTAGHHVVTATAVDSAGNDTTETVAFDVITEGDDDPDVIAALTEILAAGPDEGNGGSAWLLVVLGTAVLAVGGVGAIVIRRRRQAPATE